MSDSLKIWLRLVIATAGVAGLVLLAGSVDTVENDERKDVGSTTIAGCETGVVTAGSGAIGWKDVSIPAGPLGIIKKPLTAMERQPDGSLVTKMPVLIEGRDKITVAAASGMNGRVRLFYGKDAMSFDDPGFERVRFHPCRDRARTVWPGGIRVEGDERVRLKITIADQKPFVIGLGFPQEADLAAPDGNTK